MARLDADSCGLCVMRGRTRQKTVPDQLTYTVGAVVQEQPLINSMGVGAPRPGPSPTPNAKPKYRVKVPSGGFLNMRQGPGISFPVVQRFCSGGSKQAKTAPTILSKERTLQLPLLSWIVQFADERHSRQKRDVRRELLMIRHLVVSRQISDAFRRTPGERRSVRTARHHRD